MAKDDGYPRYTLEECRNILSTCPLLRSGKRRVLDVGCGDGYISAVIKRMGHESVGLDLSSEAVNRALEVGRMDSGLVGSVYDMELPREKFDVVVLWGACMFADRKRLFERVHGALKTGGEIFLLDHNYRNPYHKLSFMRPRWWNVFVEGKDVFNGLPLTEATVRNLSGQFFNWAPPDYHLAFTRYSKLESKSSSRECPRIVWADQSILRRSVDRQSL